MNRRTIIGAALVFMSAPAAAWAQTTPGNPDLSRYAVGPLPVNQHRSGTPL